MDLKEYDKLRTDDINNSNYSVFLQSSDGKIFFFKERSAGEIFRELLAQEILEILHISYIKCFPYTYNGRKGLLSENFRKDGYNYLSGNQLIDDYISITKIENIELLYDEKKDDGTMRIKKYPDLYIIPEALKKRFRGYPNREEQIQKFMHKIFDMVMFDLLVVNMDRNGDNWFIEYNDSSFKLLDIFDHNHAFSKYYNSALNTTQCQTLSNTEALRALINESDSSIYFRFINFFNTINPGNINSIADEVVKKYNLNVDELVRNEVIGHFTNNYRRLESVINATKQSGLISYETNNDTFKIK
jgi:hypothetical protein